MLRAGPAGEDLGSSHALSSVAAPRARVVVLAQRTPIPPEGLEIRTFLGQTTFGITRMRSQLKTMRPRIPRDVVGGILLWIRATGGKKPGRGYHQLVHTPEGPPEQLRRTELQVRRLSIAGIAGIAGIAARGLLEGLACCSMWKGSAYMAIGAVTPTRDRPSMIGCCRKWRGMMIHWILPHSTPGRSSSS